jgi:hypothetical protein
MFAPDDLVGTMARACAWVMNDDVAVALTVTSHRWSGGASSFGSFLALAGALDVAEVQAALDPDVPGLHQMPAD